MKEGEHSLFAYKAKSYCQPKWSAEHKIVETVEQHEVRALEPATGDVPALQEERAWRTRPALEMLHFLSA